jgi:hypothetical protein
MPPSLLGCSPAQLSQLNDDRISWPRTRMDCTAMMLAVAQNHNHEVITRLLKAGADEKAKESEETLHSIMHKVIRICAVPTLIGNSRKRPSKRGNCALIMAVKRYRWSSPGI